MRLQSKIGDYMRRGSNGMTLMELLVVIAVLAVLATVLLPFGASLTDYTKREKTIQVMESLRFALIGAENNYDANGNRILGGYVGQFDALPALITHYWDNTKKEWVIQYNDDLAYVYDADLTDGVSYLTDGTPTTVLYDDSKDNRDKFNQNAMPLALWTNYVKIDDSYQRLVDNDDWQGPYLVREADKFTNDDSLYYYDDGAGLTDSPANKLSIDEIDENRRFWLRQGGGRLLDGWGSALLFYMDGEDLYVVSAGSDRKIDYGTYYTDQDEDNYDNGPADTSLADNEDNLVMVLTKKQWDLTSQKTRMTQIKLKDIKTAILGKRGNMTGGVQQPNGFIADIGNLETLVGSYVYYSSSVDNAKIYKCVKNHTSPASNSSTNTPDESDLSGANWEHYATVNTADGETLATHYPFALKYNQLTNYYEANPSLLVMNANYVKAGTDPDYTYYRYIDDEVSSSTTSAPSSTSSDWVEDDTFAGHDWVLEHDTTGSTIYTNEILPSWTYYSVVEFGAGWNGPYMKNTTDPLTDAWGRQIVLEMDKGSLLIRSRGPQVYKDGTTDDYEDDDIIETIVHTDYAVPVTVIVKPEEDPDNSGYYLVETTYSSANLGDCDFVSVYSAHNGSVVYRQGFIDEASGYGGSNDGVFKFTSLNSDADKPSTPLYEFDYWTLFTNYWLSSDNSSWLPIGKVMVVYQSQKYSYRNSGSDTIGIESSGVSPYPDSTLFYNASSPNTGGTSNVTTKYSYQKSFTIQPRTNPTLILGD